MADTHVQINARYEDRIRIKHLSMEPSLQGSAVQFLFEGHQIEIKLPKIDPVAKDDRYLEAEADVWRAATGEILNVHIYVISIAIHDLKFELPQAAADHPHINASLYNDAERRVMDKKSDQLYFLARRALDYWLRVVRWKTGLGLIDIDTSPKIESVYGGKLFNNAHGGSFYSPKIARTVTVPKRHRLNQAVWQEIEAAVSRGEIPPIWNEYHMNAYRRMEQGDLVAGVIDLAMICPL